MGNSSDMEFYKHYRPYSFPWSNYNTTYAWTTYRFTSTIVKSPRQKHILELFLIASHILCDTTTFEPTKKSFKCKIDRLFDAEAIYLRNFMKECTETLISQTNGDSFVYPGDLALCLVVSDRKKMLNDIPIADHTKITERMPVIVADFQNTHKTTSTATHSLVGIS